MRNTFKALSKPEREEVRRKYVEYLKKRNGAPDFDAHTSSKRDAFFAELDARPVLASEKGRLNQDVFIRNQRRGAPEEGLDERTLWAVCAANANLTEDYGVKYGFEVKPMKDPEYPYSWVQIEENYHTRMLADCVRALGAQMEIIPPKFGTRVLLGILVQLPYYFSNVLILCAEACGLVVFKGLQKKARELFADEPEALARINALFNQIIIDEVGHVRWVHSQMGQIRLSIAKAIMPFIFRAFLRDLPAIVKLFGMDSLLAGLQETLDSGIVALEGGKVHPLDALLGQAKADEAELQKVLELRPAA
ncbi:MAG: hypothetical protein AB1405_06030 [Bdellovibrionota bacterium]